MLVGHIYNCSVSPCDNHVTTDTCCVFSVNFYNKIATISIFDVLG